MRRERISFDKTVYVIYTGVYQTFLQKETQGVPALYFVGRGIMLTLDKIYHAAFVLKDIARRTDLIEAPLLSKDCHIYLKTENLQVTGSFKVRGAY